MKMTRITPQPVLPGTTNVFVVIENMTRKRAEMMLASSPGNRKCTRVEFYAPQMRRGEWGIVTDCIGIDEEGWLLNGHNRLKAVILADVSVLMPVMYNVKRSDMAKIDVGGVRNAGNTLAIHFMNNINNCRDVAAAVRLLIPYFRNNGAGLSQREIELIATHEIVDFVESHLLEIASLKFGTKTPGSPSAVMAACFLFNRIDKGDSEAFLDCLKTSYNPRDGYPTKTLEKALANIGGRNGSARIEAFAKTIKAWNFWRQNETCKTLKWLDSEPFPKPL